MSAAKGEGFTDAPSQGDCHQLPSWHLNHPLQIGVFEMQIELRFHGQIKRSGELKTHTVEEGEKHF